MSMNTTLSRPQLSPFMTGIALKEIEHDNGEPITPRTAYCKKLRLPSEQIQRSRAEHNKLLGYINKALGLELTTSDIMALFLPRDHGWTKYIGAIPTVELAQNLPIKIMCSQLQKKFNANSPDPWSYLRIEDEKGPWTRILQAYDELIDKSKNKRFFPVFDSKKNQYSLSLEQKAWKFRQEYIAREMAQFVKDQLQEKQKRLGNVLDLMCETGALTALLKKDVDCMSVKGLDNDGAIESLGTIMHDGLTKNDFINEDFKRLDENNKQYDTIISHAFAIGDNQEISKQFVRSLRNMTHPGSVIFLGCGQLPDQNAVEGLAFYQEVSKDFDIDIIMADKEAIAGLNAVMMLTPKRASLESSEKESRPSTSQKKADCLKLSGSFNKTA